MIRVPNPQSLIPDSFFRMPLPRAPFNRFSRNPRDFLSKRGDEKDQKLTKAQERAARVLNEAKSGVRGAIPDRSNMNVPMFDRGISRGTSLGRTKKHRRIIVIEEDGDEDEELDKRAAEAEMGIASPLPRSLIRPIAVTIKKIHGLNGEVSEFKE